ncbi:MAG TPA: transporter [Longimicrobium sp.]|nr:transporter [Longimicrobium sp.]
MSRSRACGPVLLLLLAAPAAAQKGPPPIRDNSFLVEEAYNQEEGVVQHVGTWTFAERDWAFGFTQEWPVFGAHQLSITLPVNQVGDATGLGDAALHWRYQVPGLEQLRTAIAPRVSLIFPTGDELRELGGGRNGIQVALPVSIDVAPGLVTHTNLGVTRYSSASDPGFERAAGTDFNLGQSVVALVHPRFNLLLEAVWTRQETGLADGPAHVESFLVSPGARAAFDLPGEIQVVPGIAVPIGLGPSKGQRQVFFYLSVEHPFLR